jgi:ribosomal protein S18 acetylase RimI-like enzyme
LSTAANRECVVGPVTPTHRDRVAAILRGTGNFREEEVVVALELFDESFVSDDYTFIGAFDSRGVRGVGSGAQGREALSPEPQAPSPLIAFACYGPTPGTDRTFDLYWIAVDRAAQGTGCGTLLLSEVERRLEALHARMLVVETSSRSDYDATRGFYLRRDYVEAARVRGFYAPDDDRIILTKRLAGSPRRGWGAVA